MARLVKDAEEGLVEESLVVSGRDAAVARPQVGAERMRGRVQAPGVEVEPDLPGHFAPERLLHVHRIAALEDRDVWLPAA